MLLPHDITGPEAVLFHSMKGLAVLSSSRPRRLAGVSIALVLVGAGVVLPQTAFANPATVPGPTTIITPGAFSDTVPAGSCFVEASVLGAAGGKAQAIANSNGAGARITATFAVTPGAEYSGSVGGGGAAVRTAGVNGGGLGGVSSSNTHPGAGGGGYSELILGTSSAILAGGGGGSSGGHTAGTEGFGGNAGLPATSGSYATGTAGTNGHDDPTSIVVGGGAGGTQNAAGAGGVHSTTAARNGTAGSGRTGGEGGADVNADTGGGGGGGVFGGGGGASTIDEGAAGSITGGGGGGGSSYVSAAATNLTAVAGPTRPGNAQGAGDNGSVTLTWIGCDYDLALTKTASQVETTIGDTITWTVEVQNLGPDAMTLGDAVTLTDTVPGDGATTITGISVSGGSNATLERGPISCDATVGDPMPETLECDRVYQPRSGSASGSRGLDVGETLTVTYTQDATGSVGTQLENTASITDRKSGDTNDTATATTTLVADPPVANNDDDLDNAIGAVVTVPVLANDEGTIVPGSVALINPVSGAPITGSHVVPGEGDWSVNTTTGAITFTPLPGFKGDPTPVDYEVTDSNGLTDTATVTVAYVPEAVDDKDLDNTIGDTIDIDVLANDNGNFDPATVRIVTSGAPASILEVPGQGTWSVEAGGVIRFTPEAGFLGDPDPVEYQVEDTTGDVTSASITASYIPEAADDVSSGNTIGDDVTLDVLGNDTGEFDPSSVSLVDPVTGAPRKTVVVTGEGTWTANPNGSITFAPANGYKSNPTPIAYEVTDTTGDTVAAGITVTYVSLASNDVSGDNEEGAPVTVDVIANDDGTFDPTSVKLIDPSGALVTTLTVGGEGVWAVDPLTGEITFTPEAGFTGDPTPVRYQVTTVDGDVTTASVTITYEHPQAAPEASDPEDQPEGNLAFTGSDPLPAISLAALALLLGAAGLVITRRRRAEA